MVTEINNKSVSITNNDIAPKIADAEYYIAIAMVNGNSRRKKHWLRIIDRLKAQLNGKEDTV